MTKMTLVAVAALISGAAHAKGEAQWCSDEKSCAAFCNGEKVNAAAVHAKGYQDPKGLVPLSAVSKDLGCGARQEKAKTCGFYLPGGGSVVPALKPVLEKAVANLKKLNPNNV